MKLNRAPKTPPEIPTSSMADIAFLLIVFFMVTTVFSANKGMDHILPPEQDPGEPEDAILIKVTDSGTFLMDRQPFTMDQVARIYPYVLSKLQSNRNKPVIITADGQASYGDMVSALDMVKVLEADLAAQSPGYALSLTIATKTEAARFPQPFR